MSNLPSPTQEAFIRPIKEAYDALLMQMITEYDPSALDDAVSVFSVTLPDGIVEQVERHQAYTSADTSFVEADELYDGFLLAAHDIVLCNSILQKTSSVAKFTHNLDEFELALTQLLTYATSYYWDWERDCAAWR